MKIYISESQYKLLKSILEIIENTYGVDGWHFNGKIAYWRELISKDELQDLAAIIATYEKNKGISDG